ncbi:hypothetical protein A2662_03645 [Candidatus Giovannonibacteria bacterium RIFCSPHIGHO2_01_FULL_45_33]|uniref:Uncharacterized protein n=1 Tax=Candidatus Giovannonibacteria bacterium RIFCSPLOWO2_01_FULL_45_34 TaxID=1798351 RepID=A0A1F5WYK4_9BACT|nr:MAG: hypothetical protein A2662_03645 [Candidatus Giovannonibacteria bacterium RIFCSPHIGHO2_01_FULL_45_33]OGF70887.1 MAG: hypothetical protein A3C73_04800 [Candidatus Giovannonibacteria bacterium RIFCSPHIGHO2_02_FULL_44_11]OGF80736.1 MAG: hypothetical protein A2930_03680 [Candidatus Giovannonibacteria bacterium RIFCSPLOWO2_01_FULL_45_34]
MEWNLKTVGLSLICTLFAFGAGWVNHHVHAWSALWWLSAFVIIGAGLYAIRFWLYAALATLAFALVVGLIGYIIAFPW